MDVLCGEMNMTKFAERGHEVVSLQLVATYPVFWTRFAVLRDFVQNFYDAAGRLAFAEAVRIQGVSGDLTIEMEGEGFELGWLTHIGASSKTQAQEGSTAGYFGEGFKIAALCAVRDFGWGITMGSKTWSARVEFASEHIGRNEVRVLSYHVSQSNPLPGRTWLKLTGLTPDDLSLAREVRLCFDFIGNPLIGERVCSNQSVAVYRATEQRPGRQLPITGSKSDTGTLFLGHQARATLPFPLIVSMPKIRTKERDRPSLYDFQVIDYLADAAACMDAGAAAEVLVHLRRHWRLPAPRGFKCGSWANVVSKLVYTLAKSPGHVARFRSQFPNLLVREPVSRANIPARNRRAQASAWLRVHGPKSTVVQRAFGVLGYPTLESACEVAGGFARAAQIDDVRAKRIQLLQVFARQTLAPLVEGVHSPDVKLLDLHGTGFLGIATTTPLPELRYSLTGRRIRSTVHEVCLAATLLDAPSPDQAFATFVHECCHAFGGDGAFGFSAALTDAIALLASQGLALTLLREAWTAVGVPHEASAAEQYRTTGQE